MIELRPQQGPQEQFLSSPADIAIYGGSAGGGKTYALLLEPLRHMDNPGFGVVIFRRDSGQITNEGGLWDNAKDIYRPLGATFMESAPKRVIFPSGAKITFNHLHTDDAVYGYQGAQVALICFDELTHFSETFSCVFENFHCCDRCTFLWCVTEEFVDYRFTKY